MPPTTPKLPPPPGPSPKKRLQEIICAEMVAGNNAQDRQKFSVLLDLLNGHGDRDWPVSRADGKGTRGSRRDIVYAAILKTLQFINDPARQVDVNTVLAFIEWAWKVPATEYRIVGDQGLGYTMERIAK